jgi:hypothetical protein
MSIPRYKINPLFGYLKDAKDGKFCEYRDYLKLEAENASLKAEVHRMASFTTRTIIPNEELQAQVKRLTKAGDAFISVGFKMREMIGDHHWTLEFDRVRTDWYFAAKEGKQS